jgi:sulfur-oxidizing protein SoxA
MAVIGWNMRALVGVLVLATLGLVAADPARGQGRARAPLALDASVSPTPWTRYAGWPKDDYSKYNTLADLTQSPPAGKEPRRLAGPIAGDARKGQDLAFDRRRGGSCLACHAMGQRGSNLPGNVGPDLSEIGSAGREDEWLFNYVFDPRVYNPDSIMPPWGAHGIFSAAEVNDIVAFLKTLKAPIKYTDPLDDPEKRPVPVEDRDNLDAMVNPAVWRMEEGEALFRKAGANGRACVACHANPAASLKGWAARMPYFEPRLGKVLGVEEFIARHAPPTTGDRPLMQSDANLALSLYLRNISYGVEINVDLDRPGNREAYARGEKLNQAKIGRMNLACVDCHTQERGGLKWIRGQWLGEARGQIPHFPNWRTSRQEIWDIRKRFEWCNVAIQASELPPDAPVYGDLELYLTARNNGLKAAVPGIRH